MDMSARSSHKGYHFGATPLEDTFSSTNHATSSQWCVFEKRFQFERFDV